MSGVRFKTSTLLVGRLLFKHKRTAARQIVAALDVLCNIEVSKSVELAGDTVHSLPQLLNERRVFERGRMLVLRYELLKLRLPCDRHGVAGEKGVELRQQRFLPDVGLATAAFLFGAPIVGMTFLHFGGDAHTALATA